MRVILVRHGQTEWNLQNRIQGWMDSPLTAQARKETENIDIANLQHPIIYTSDLGRACSTATILANKFQGRVVVDCRLRERRFGILEGCVIDQDIELYREWAAYQRRYSHHMTGVYQVEKEQDFEQRVKSFMDTLRCQDARTDVVIVSHGEWLRAFQNMLYHLPSWIKGSGIVENITPIELAWQEADRNEGEKCQQLT
ncbi:histidine phosphatase family protein [Vibrio sp. 99-8-1]|uniref:histidine phosphatase family protein n=1 Tax=Vibrio sp. 99-8-1 TaxID=2607602 RepID=UPI001493BDAF|nr:histidine phosphatase family protein [Vibrio sp. 99-8-1]NOI65264.1 histidine phosphatase family protein [Vibrio sp. 99-8-1]